jgi:hypothetical protein
MDITLNNEQYWLLIVNKDNYLQFSKLINTYTICNPTFIDNFYEKMTYSLLEYDNYIGIFLLDKTKPIIYSSLIIDINCEQIEDKLETLGYSISESVEITLLCSNYVNHIKGLTFIFFTYVINSVIKYYNPNCKNIFLTIAKGNENKKAIAFYTSIGFQTIESNIMMYSYKGGKQSNQKKYNKNIYLNRNKRKTRKYKQKYHNLRSVR